MELTTPITVYWDLPDDDGNAPEAAGREIAAIRPLTVQALLPPHPSPVVWEALRTLASVVPALVLTVPAAAGAVLAAECGRTGIRPRELLVSCSSREEVRDAIPWLTGACGMIGTAAGIAVPVSRANWRLLPEMPGICRDAGVTRLVLPMERLYSGNKPFFLSRQEQDELGAALAGVERGGVTLTIHDPFLWRAFHPGLPFPQAGCQAANTMIAVAADGGVYPCPTLPVRLGSVKDRPLREIVASPEKAALRHRLLTLPAGCAGCREGGVCRGGCRGRGLVLHNSLDGSDDACR